MALLLGRGASASSTGIVGYSGLQGDTCGSCHSGGVEPAAHFAGPVTVVAGSLPTMSFVVESAAPKQTQAGFDVAASGGELEPGPGSRAEAGEIAHSEPRAAQEGRALWTFRWRVPAQPGEYMLYGSGLSANGNGGRGGDESSSVVQSITVVPNPLSGDANCDDRVSAADFAAAAMLSAGVKADECGRADADCDGSLGPGDVDAIIAAVFNPPAPEPCPG